MNLVSYEFVACQDAKKGVLILSEVILKTPSVNISAVIVVYTTPRVCDFPLFLIYFPIPVRVLCSSPVKT